MFLTELALTVLIFPTQLALAVLLLLTELGHTAGAKTHGASDGRLGRGAHHHGCNSSVVISTALIIPCIHPL